MDAQSGAVAGFDSGAGGAIAKGKKGVLRDFAGGRLNGNDRILQFRDAATFSELPRGSCDCFRRQPGFVFSGKLSWLPLAGPGRSDPMPQAGKADRLTGNIEWTNGYQAPCRG